jgi:glycosyltransferase involved in cell wall biosynthesis
VAIMTGIGRYVEELTLGLAALQAEGWSYDLSSPREARRPSWLPAGVHYRGVPLPRQVLRVLWATSPLPRVERFVGPFDIVHSLHASSPIPTRHRSVVTVHDLMPLVHPEWHTRAVSWSAGKALSAMRDEDVSVITVSGYVADQVREIGGIDPERITVIHHGVDDRFRVPAPPPVRSELCQRLGLDVGGFLLAVGRIGTRKNLVTAIRAMAESDAGGLPLVLAGKSDDGSPQVQSEIERLKLGERIRLIGFVPDDDLPVLVQSARALLHPAVDEGFGLPPAEAMAAGTPVVAARAGSLPEVVGDAGILVAPTDASEWAGAISRLTGDDDLHATLSESGRARAQKFTWERAVRRTQDVYESAAP